MHNNWNRRKNEKQTLHTFALPPLVSEVWSVGRFGYSPLTNLRTHSSVISLSTWTTVSSTWSRHIAIAFLRTYKGYHHAPRVFSIDQNFLYSFFLIPEFLLWASCPCPNHCCLTLVSLHTANKNKTQSSLPPSLSDSWCPWTESLTSTPEPTSVTMALLSSCLLSLAQHSLQRYLFRQYMVGQSCSWQEMGRRNSGKENKLHEHNPILVLKTVVS